MIKAVRILALGMVCLVYGCGGEMNVQDRYSLEYLQDIPGKPVIYPAGVNGPAQSRDYFVPELSTADRQADYDLNELVKPPRLVIKPVSKKDKKVTEEKK